MQRRQCQLSEEPMLSLQRTMPNWPNVRNGRYANGRNGWKADAKGPDALTEVISDLDPSDFDIWSAYSSGCGPAFKALADMKATNAVIAIQGTI